MYTLRRNIVQQFSEVLKTHSQVANKESFVERLLWCVRLGKQENDSVTISVPYNLLKVTGIAPTNQEIQPWVETVTGSIQGLQKIVGESSYDLYTDQQHTAIAGEKSLNFTVNNEEFVKLVLKDIVTSSNNFADLCGDFVKYRSSHDLFLEEKPNQNIVVDYSSPNIAKPFHAGHLRSTVIGNMICNLNEYFGHHVTRLNYLGDWGTQFGYIGVGMKNHYCEEEFKQSPMHHYYKVYVKANKEAELDSSIHQQAKNFFSNMENGKERELELWKQCRETSIEEYKKTYQRLGVKFDVYDGESLYKDQSQQVLDRLKSAGLLHTDSESGFQYVESSQVTNGEGSNKVIVRKSDGSSLYITRDIAAALRRLELYNFDRLLYVVGIGQNFHFENLKKILAGLGCTFAKEQHIEDLHVRFGSVQGMSTRAGNIVFLQDILDTAKLKMLENMKSKDTTKIRLDDSNQLEEVADKLAVSAIVIQDLKHGRLKTYKFDWDKMTKFTGNTGVFLQYTHSRLCSLIRETAGNRGNTELLESLLDDSDTATLTEMEAVKVVHCLAKYDLAVYKSFTRLEPYILVNYLFDLSHLTSKALKSLYVKNQPENVANSRLLMFHCVQLVLADGLKLLGLSPLDKM